MTLIRCHLTFTPALPGTDRAGGRKLQSLLFTSVLSQVPKANEQPLVCDSRRAECGRVLPGHRPGSPLPPATRPRQPAELPARGAELAEGTPGWGRSWQAGNHGACSHLLAFMLPPLSLSAPTAGPGRGGERLRGRPGGRGSRGASGTPSWPARARPAGCVYSGSPLVCRKIGVRGKKGGGKEPKSRLAGDPSVWLRSSRLILPSAHLLPPTSPPFTQYLGKAELAACAFCSRASAKKAHEQP